MLKASHGIVSSQFPAFSSGSGMITYWDLQNTNSYSGVGNTITDLDGTNDGLLVGTVSYTGGSPNYLSLDDTTNKKLSIICFVMLYQVTHSGHLNTCYSVRRSADFSQFFENIS